MVEPKLVDLPELVYRVGRGSDPIHFSDVSVADAQLRSGGNRFDIAGGQVLYAASEVAACFGETLSRFRPTPVMRELLAEEDPGFMLCGGVPLDWRVRRTLATLRAVRPLPFVDVDHPETLAYLSENLAPQLAALGYKDNLDLADVRSGDRLLTRAISLWAFVAEDEEGEPLYGGLAYRSRISDEWHNWAIFSGTEIEIQETTSIERTNPDLLQVARMWNLVVH